MRRNSDVSLEIIQFYPDTLMNLECLIVFKYEGQTKLLQFENFYEHKQTKFEFSHKENNKNALVDFKIYGGGDKKIFIGGGSVNISHSMFNHNTIKIFERSYSCILTQGGKEFLFPFNYPINDNACIRLEIVVKNNNLFKQPNSLCLGNIVIVNHLESDEVHVLNESCEESGAEMMNQNKTNFEEKTDLKESVNAKPNIDIYEITRLINNLSPINKQSIDFFKNTSSNQTDNNLDNSKFDTFFDEEKESNFDSFLDRPAIFNKTTYPPKKDYSQAKSPYSQKVVLLHDLYANKETYCTQFVKAVENAEKLRNIILNYQFLLFKMKKKHHKLHQLKLKLAEKVSQLNMTDKVNSTTLKNESVIHGGVLNLLKKIFSVKFNKIDVLKGIQSKYKEKDIKELLVKVMKKVSDSSIKLLCKEKRESYVNLNKRLKFTDEEELERFINPSTYKLISDIPESKLSQEEFDAIYKPKKISNHENSRYSIRKKSKIRKSFIGSRRSMSINGTMTIKDDAASRFPDKQALSNVVNEKGQDSESELSCSLDRELDEAMESFLTNNTNYRPFEVLKIGDNLYELDGERFVFDREKANPSELEIVTKSGKQPFTSLLKRHAKVYYKDLSSSLGSLVAKPKEVDLSAIKQEIMKKVNSQVLTKKLYSPKIRVSENKKKKYGIEIVVSN